MEWGFIKLNIRKEYINKVIFYWIVKTCIAGEYNNEILRTGIN